MTKNIKWTLEKILSESIKYQNRNAFKHGSPSAYDAARRRKLVDIVCEHMSPKLQTWTKEKVALIAKKYKNRNAFKKGDPNAYDAALKRLKCMDEICSHMSLALTLWDEDLIQKEANKYLLREDFYRGSRNAHAAACARGILDKVCSHMEYKPSSENDAVYIWKAKELTFNGLPVYKMGVTSYKKGLNRISRVSSMSKIQPEIILFKKVSIKATTIEKDMHKIGFNPGYSGFNGSTEFRAMSNDELARAINLVEKYSVSDYGLI